jgi:UDP-N-acetylglucosamine diphosphorylase / glucose-1-phosphate thymidylyltransferase / UDP-N-acetylgalactosamine diphosphorylase / glucosamine-1-phosphate N-acetyltransferase / galactosamine-1-phosphate N-acetyltransferase
MSLQAVILCAGKGTRMLPLTEAVPKPMQIVAGKNLIEWKLEALPPEVKEAVLVIGYLGEQIREHFGDTWKGKAIRYVVQKELNGTAGALLSAKEILGERFLVMMGDDLYDRNDIAKLIASEWGICVQEVHQKEIGGEMLVDNAGNFVGMREERHFVEYGLANTGLYMLRHEILNIPPVPIGGSSTEFGLPHTVAVIAKHTPVTLIKTQHWMQISKPDDLMRAEEFVAIDE